MTDEVTDAEHGMIQETIRMETELIDLQTVAKDLVYHKISSVMGSLMFYLPEMADALYDPGYPEHTYPKPISELTVEGVRDIYSICQEAMNNWDEFAEKYDSQRPD